MLSSCQLPVFSLRRGRRLPGALVLFAVTAWLGVLGVWGPVSPAGAHSQLVSSSPADGSTVDALPANATLTFNEEVHPKFVQAVVAPASGEARPAEAVAQGPKVVVTLPQDLGGGKIAVRYRVVSKDGHPISGEISFTVPGGQPPGQSGRDASSGTPGSSAPTGTTSSEQGRPVTTPNGGSPVAVYLLTGGAAVLLLVLGILVYRWDRQREPQ
ncbi:copper resistance CopC family protein [Austwickia chelonae]|uniref:copper resistance CopC family protein n=1 Tax=Austwickia chelonae TaxID=100225 RepID=UPI0013C36EF5|nr:copper resistance protein CopC [Austwickia chelonae]